MSRPEREAVRASEVLGAIFTGCRGPIEFRAFGSRARMFVAIASLATAGEFYRARRDHEDLYFGVATRRSEEDGSLTNCQHLGALFADIDFKDISEAEARLRLTTCPSSPSIIVQLDGGLHCYWVLRAPFDLTTEVHPGHAAAARGLARTFCDDSPTTPGESVVSQEHHHE